MGLLEAWPRPRYLATSLGGDDFFSIAYLKGFLVASWELGRAKLKAVLRFYIRVILGLYWGYIGVILGLYWGYIRVILGLYWGYIRVILG